MDEALNSAPEVIQQTIMNISTNQFKRSVQCVVTAAILSVYGASSQLLADETADTLKSLKQEIELLNQRVKSLEGQLNQKTKALEEQLDQKVKVVDRKRELDAEATQAALKN